VRISCWRWPSSPLARREDAAGQRRLRDDAALPHRRQQVIPADHALAMANQVLEQIEDLRFDDNRRVAAPQFAARRIEAVAFEQIQQGRRAGRAWSRAEIKANSMTCRRASAMLTAPIAGVMP